MPDTDMAKIRWPPRLRPELLERLYRSDAQGLRDIELCDEVGMILYCRCEAFLRVDRGEVECPVCGTVFRVSREGTSPCPGARCGWRTTWDLYALSYKNYYVFPGRALAAYASYCRQYPLARTYPEKMLLIDRLIHSFHMDEQAGAPVKSVASKLLEGNKKEVVRFLDRLSARDPIEKDAWRREVEKTIDSRIVRSAEPGSTAPAPGAGSSP